MNQVNGILHLEANNSSTVHAEDHLDAPQSNKSFQMTEFLSLVRIATPF